MNKTISAIRIIVLVALAVVSLYLLAGDTDAPLSFFLLIKIIGMAGIVITYSLYKIWQCDPAISKFEKWSNRNTAEVNKAKNPMRE